MKYKLLLLATILMFSSCAYRTVKPHDSNEKPYYKGNLTKAYIDFGTPEEPSNIIGFYSGEVNNQYDYFRYESKFPSIKGKKKVNRKSQMVCLDYNKGNYKELLDCSQAFLSKPKRAYGKWVVSNVVFIENHGLYTMVSTGMEIVQFSKFNNDNTYETFADALFSSKEFFSYEK